MGPCAKILAFDLDQQVFLWPVWPAVFLLLLLCSLMKFISQKQMLPSGLY